MLEQVTKLANGFLGEELEEAQQQALAMLCTATLSRWQERLLPEHSPDDCAMVLIPAAAFSALAIFLTAHAVGTPCASFSAGDIAVRYDMANVEELTERLGLWAEQLMRPYVGDGAFCFRGVRA